MPQSYGHPLCALCAVGGAGVVMPPLEDLCAYSRNVASQSAARRILRELHLDERLRFPLAGHAEIDFLPVQVYARLHVLEQAERDQEDHFLFQISPNLRFSGTIHMTILN